ncbi:MAG: hypothetical protein EB084_23470 [Proteobacteria bacterium]|nr:hypothetical protein [Pseudomonadota bacterium]
MLSTVSTSRPPATPQPTAIDPKKPVSMTLRCYVPIYTNAHLGGTPEDVFNLSNTPIEGTFTPCTPEKCGVLPKEVYHYNPLLQPDGSPRFRAVDKHIEDAPKSPLAAGSLWGLIGGAAAGTLGVLGGAVIGSPVLGGVIGAAAGALVSGGVGAWRSRGDCIRLVWDVYPIYDTKYVGYKEEVTQRVQGGQQGYLHHFEPVLQSKRLGEFKLPRIEHYRENP